MPASQQQGSGGGGGLLVAAAAARGNLLRDSVQVRAAAVRRRWAGRKREDSCSEGSVSPAAELHVIQQKQQQQEEEEEENKAEEEEQQQRRRRQQRCDNVDSSEDEKHSSEQQWRRRQQCSRKRATRGLDYSRWARRAESRVFLPILSGSESTSVDDLRPVGAATGSQVEGAGTESAVAAETQKREGKSLSSAGVVSAESAVGAASGVPQPPLLDNDEELREEERVELAIKAVKRLEGGLLREIYEIKERHKTLEALTATRARAAKNEATAATSGPMPATAAAAKKPIAAPPSRPQRELPAQLLRPVAHRPTSSRRGQPPQQQQHYAVSEQSRVPTQTSERSSPQAAATADLSRPEKATFLRAPGVAWKIRSLSPGDSGRQASRGGAQRTTVPTIQPLSAGARFGRRQLRQWTDLDLGSAYFLPPSVSEAKTPIEAALRLHKVLTELALLNPSSGANQRATGVSVNSRT